ncbi:hypothetical protein L211DRAFT_842909 [Terfezia boudieri ATCC MYA-4762]|uniref:Uncharacterized protein n=1 Tax=Terfezia boudieri ATCC MYA-4762 TaxID=1051890 RepID=A0A3N4L995_9PEZI|nr:hypothetical protein L211DRAFT_842909 [Terfezia boudieri ATCC MYA-4762]
MQFTHLSNEIVEDTINNIENAILASYLPNEVNEPESVAPVSSTPPPVTPSAALAHIEGLLLFLISPIISMYLVPIVLFRTFS